MSGQHHNTAEVICIEAIQDILSRLDRIDQLLREIGKCDDCGQAHYRDVTLCVENATTE